MLKKIGIVVVVLVIAILGFATTKPDTFHMERSVTIQAPPEKVLPHVADFHAWTAWSPWEKLDPAMKRTYSGAASGKGAVYEWEGNSEVGQGRMEITDANASSGVTIKLDFIKPMEGHNIAEFKFAPEGGATKVTWAMHGPNNYLSKVMQVFIDMDKMLGAYFESGLADLKAASEK
ncbi:MAG TPA: SRPBCC family protein [Bryobacteraceae bacterium]|nr:SRPBCC family protein [Bryobacteraceae bacterium]